MTDRFRTSFAQQRLWFLDQYEPGTALYNIPKAWRLEGLLDERALGLALDAIVARHEVLRTTFEAEGGAPVQVIAPGLSVAPRVEPIEDGDEAALRRKLDEEAARPFDLARGPLLRARLYRLAPEVHVLQLTVHHIVSDGWSGGVLMRELGALYRAALDGSDAGLPDLPVQYADFAEWQRDWLRGAALQEQLAYWRDALAGAPPLLALPLDRPRVVRSERPAGQVEFELGADVVRALRELARREQCSLFMVIAAAFSVVLQRHSGQDDFCLGYPSAGRTRPELEGLIGFFVNTLVLRVKLDPAERFDALLRRVRASVLDADAHQDLPFEKLVEELQPDRGAGHSPLFQVMLSLYALEGGTGDMQLALPGISATRIRNGQQVSKFDLSAEFLMREHTLSATLVYNACLFDHATVAAIAEQCQTLLADVAARPDASVRDLRLLTPKQRRQRLEAGSGTTAGGSGGVLLHEQFQAQVAATPEAIAVVSDRTRLSYSALNAQANRVAHWLKTAHGIGPGDYVAIRMDRGSGQIVALLAAMKAGAAFVPQDPEHPPERLARMLDDCGARVLICDAASRSRLAASTSVEGPAVLDLEDDSAPWLGGPATDPPSDATPRAAEAREAYVIYTSGSTGQPKGVRVTHASVSNLLMALEAAIDGPQATHAPRRVTMNAPFAFDSSVKQWTRLLRGDGLYIVPAEVRLDPPAMRRWLVRHEITSLDVTPSMLRALLEVHEPRAWPERLLLGGEAVDARLWARVVALRDVGVRAFNVYGPTECTVDATCAAIDDSSSRPVIGRALAGMRVYVLDVALEPVPAGVAGQLHIGGAGVARGYLGRPGLTAERFIADPFGPPGARMYRTGDLARMAHDGTIEYLGRADQQLKIRGFRVEPAEIEQAVRQSGLARQVAVLGHGEREDERRLVAYVVPASGSSPTPQALTLAAQARLPAYMVPTAWVLLPDLPMNGNGKLDLRALPPPDFSHRAEPDLYVAPRTTAEAALAALWADVLQVGRVGVHDNFFALGGHSLLAARVVARARASLGLTIALRSLFETPTVASLLSAERESAGTATSLPPLRRRSSGEFGVRPSFGQQRLWFLDQYEPGTALYNIPKAWWLEGLLDERALGLALDAIVARHEVLRTTFEAEGGAPVQVIAPGLSVAPRVEPIEDGDEAALRRKLDEEAARPFDLARGPLLRARLYRLAPEVHVLQLTVHHIVSDGWSGGVLMRELGALYRAALDGSDAGLPDLPVQYADFAEWQRDWLRGAALQEQLAYWRDALAGAPPLLALPLDRPRVVRSERPAGQVEFELGADVVRALRELARREQCSLFMVIAAAFSVVLQRHSGQDDFCLGYPSAGRTRPELEGLIGFFVNTLVLRVKLDPAERFDALLRRVRASVLDADAHQDLPFEKLVEELQPDRGAGHSPLFQVMLGMSDAADQRLVLPGIESCGLAGLRERVKYDLSLNVSDRSESIRSVLLFDADLFDRATMLRMAEQFQTLLASAVSDPEGAVGGLKVLSELEREHVLAVGKGPGELAQDERGVHELFEAQAASTPEAVAVVCGGRTLSYRELDEWSSRVAWRLHQAYGVRAESRVAIAMERSLEMVVALLGVLKAGAAYVPMDPEHPGPRLSAQLRDAGVRVVLTQQHLRERLPVHEGVTLALDDGEPGWTQGPVNRVGEQGSPQQLAYCIYTSGSTGQPKAVMVSRGNLSRYVAAAAQRLGIEPGMIYLYASPFFADLGNTTLFLALSAGGTLCLLEPQAQLDAERVAELMARWRVDCLKITPSHLAALMSGRDAAGFLPRRRLVFGGEPLTAELVARCRREGLSIHNHYGPTEATIGAVAGEVTGDEVTRQRMALGRAMAGMRVYVLDAALEPVPAGVAGELYIGGGGVARGYLNRPGQTAERFIADPYGAPGARMYRTGDLARMDERGVVEYMGRIDQQLKIRGFRVEPAEVEQAVLETGLASEVAVLGSGPDETDLRLVGYVVAAAGAAPSAQALTLAAQARLPAHMVPAAWVLLPALPLNANGKLDRAALPVPELSRPASGIEYVEPVSDIDKVMAGIWCDVLKLERVGMSDNFFSLGGTSLDIPRVAAKIRSAFRVSIPVRQLFMQTTLADVSEVVSMLVE
ncbi:amino acid adenylation domain-containing protein [Roseateles sp.]|uniref:amino acid adenylation domain-containing protein n=1 Tax=Roseateles sp. TaxID=1971397 RepID=UPI003D0DBA25